MSAKPKTLIWKLGRICRRLWLRIILCEPEERAALHFDTPGREGTDKEAAWSYMQRKLRYELAFGPLPPVPACWNCRHYRPDKGLEKRLEVNFGIGHCALQHNLGRIVRCHDVCEEWKEGSAS